MQITAETFWLPKQGYALSDYEDAYYPNSFIKQQVSIFRCAVADGATESSFAGQWARLLVKAYCEDKLKGDDFNYHLPKLQQQWLSQVTAQPLPWYAEEKLQQGAFSALVGLTLYQQPRTGKVLAIGDSCLFQVRQENLIHCFPLTHSQQFNNNPSLLSSNVLYNKHLAEHIYQINIKWQRGDEFYLMTDALAYWFLHNYEQQSQPWQTLRHLIQSNFKDWIIKLIAAQHLSNDDVTLMRILLK